MPQDIHGGLFNDSRFFIQSQPRNSGTKGRSQAGYDGSIVPSQVIQLYSFWDPIVLFRVLRSANQDLRVIILCRGQLKQ